MDEKKIVETIERGFADTARDADECDKAVDQIEHTIEQGARRATNRFRLTEVHRG